MSEEIGEGVDSSCTLISANNVLESHKAAEEDILLETEKISLKEESGDGEQEIVERDAADCLNIGEGPNKLDVKEVVLELDKIYTETIEENEIVPSSPLKTRRKLSTVDVVNYDENGDACEMNSLDCFPQEHEDLEDNDLDLRELAMGAMRHAEEIVRKMLMRVSWTICHFHALPKWLQDNDFIWQGYRPPLPSFWDCIKSIFSIHTETGNIWTHMLG